MAQTQVMQNMTAFNLIDSYIGGIGPHRYSFNVGNIDVLIEQGRRLSMEEGRRLSNNFLMPGEKKSTEENMSDRFCDYIYELIRLGRGKEIGALLDNADKLYFLDTHGTSDKDWFFQFGNEKNEILVPAEKYLNQVIKKHKIDAAIISSCNRGDVRLDLNIPVIYATNAYNVHKFAESSVFHLPNGKEVSEKKAKANLESFVNGLIPVLREEATDLSPLRKKHSHWSKFMELKEFNII